MRFSRVTLTGAALVAAVVAAAVAYSEPGTRAEVSAGTPADTIEGKVARLLRNDRDEVDGLELEGGQEVRFPPHVGRDVEKQIKAGSRIKVQGRDEARPKGEKVFEAQTIESDGGTIAVERPRPPRPGRPMPPPDREQPMSARGKVREFVTNREGDVDGLVLDEETQVRFPPHQGKALQSLAEKGREVRVEGRRHETPDGAIHLHADSILDVASGKSVERDAPKGPRPPDSRAERDSRPERDDAGPEARRPEPHEEILRELRAIRRLLEEHKK